MTVSKKVLGQNCQIIFSYIFLPLGVEQSRREQEVDRLNQSYIDVIGEKGDIKSCLSHLVSTESYRMLDGWSYSLNPKSLRPGSRSIPLAEQTDVSLYI